MKVVCFCKAKMKSLTKKIVRLLYVLKIPMGRAVKRFTLYRRVL